MECHVIINKLMQQESTCVVMNLSPRNIVKSGNTQGPNHTGCLWGGTRVAEGQGKKAVFFSIT